MEYIIIDGIHQAGHGQICFNIVGIEQIDNCIFVKIYYEYNIIAINIKDTSLGFTCIESPKYFISYARKQSVLGDVSSGTIRRVNDGLAFCNIFNHHSIHVNNIVLRIQDSNKLKFYRYPQLKIVWLNIRTHFMAITHITLPDIQKIIKQLYLILFNTTLRPSFKLF